jgi:hypothetical protein
MVFEVKLESAVYIVVLKMAGEHADKLFPTARSRTHMLKRSINIPKTTPGPIKSGHQVPPDTQYEGLKQLFQANGLVDSTGRPTAAGRRALAQ